MKTRNTKTQLIDSTTNTNFTLHLIREELKTRKFFNTLRKAGIEDCYLQPDLGTLILKSLGLNDGKDDTFYYYSDLMDLHSKRIKADYQSIQKQAANVYRKLMKKKR